MGIVTGTSALYVDINSTSKLTQEALVNLHLEKVVTQRISLIANGEEKILIPENTMFPAKRTYHVVLKESIHGHRPIYLGQNGKTLVEVPIEASFYTDGLLNLKIVCELEYVGSRLTVIDMIAGKGLDYVIYPNYSDLAIDIRGLPLELQHYLEVEEIMHQRSNPHKEFIARTLGDLIDSFDELYYMDKNYPRKLLLGKAIVLKNLASINFMDLNGPTSVESWKEEIDSTVEFCCEVLTSFFSDLHSVCSPN